MTERDRLICDNLKLVNYTIWRYYPDAGVNDDIYQIGCIGLIKAVDTFNSTNGAAFSSYAVKCILNEIRMELRKRKHMVPQVSLETILFEGDTNQLMLGDIIAMEDEHYSLVISDYERTLDLRERAILHYLLAGETQLWIAHTMGISKQTVYRIVKNMRKKYNKGVSKC